MLTSRPLIGGTLKDSEHPSCPARPGGTAPVDVLPVWGEHGDGGESLLDVTGETVEGGRRSRAAGAG